MSLVRRLATVFGERCVTTLQGTTEPVGRGHELVVGTTTFRVTRVLRAHQPSGTAEWVWEIWGRPVRTAESTTERSPNPPRAAGTRS
jgi:hypothetical protein